MNKLSLLVLMFPLAAVAQEGPAPATGEAPPTAAPPAAETPAPAPAETAAPPPAAGELDPVTLQLLMANDEAGPKLQLYGFADTTYFGLSTRKNSYLATMFGKFGSFYVGHVNLYADAAIADGWRSLFEVRFTYMPSGAVHVSDTGLATYEPTVAQDYANFYAKTDWGGLQLERAYIEYTAREWLTIRAGQFLTPYGIWVMDHGTPTVIAMNQPFVISSELIPERQAGLLVTGSVPIADASLRYYLTLSNGRSPSDMYRDLDANKALGGRLELSAQWLGSLQLGVSAYSGRYTDRAVQFSLDADGQAVATQVIRAQYDEQSVAVDARLELAGFTALGEVVINHRAFTDRGRPPASFAGNSGMLPTQPSPPGELAPDGRRIGAYGLVGYRFAWLGVMPFFMTQYFSGNDGSLPELDYLVLHTLGVNARVRPEVVIKVQANLLDFVTLHDDSLLAKEDAKAYGAQIAWAF